jgi:hypothetical protein
MKKELNSKKGFAHLQFLYKVLKLLIGIVWTQKKHLLLAQGSDRVSQRKRHLTWELKDHTNSCCGGIQCSDEKV